MEIIDDMTVVVRTTASGARPFDYFRAFGPQYLQEDVFEEVAPLMQSAIDGYNVCIMAYGQTGSGKTFTIYGEPAQRGLVSRCVEELFRLLTDGDSTETSRFSVRCSMVELYLDQFRDLLSEEALVNAPVPRGTGVGVTPRHKLEVKSNGMLSCLHACLLCALSFLLAHFVAMQFRFLRAQCLCQVRQLCHRGARHAGTRQPPSPSALDQRQRSLVTLAHHLHHLP